MKYLLILLALVPLVWGFNYQEIEKVSQRSISSQIVAAIEEAKEQMHCGFPEYGVPPLVPFKIDHKEIAIEKYFIQALGEINNFRLFGLNEFDIVELKLSPLKSYFNFEFNWSNINYTTDYELSTNKSINISGPAKLVFNNFTVQGAVKYKIGTISGKLSLKELKLNTSLGKVISEIEGISRFFIVNKKINRAVEEWFMLAVNDNIDQLNEVTNSMLMPVLNDKLSNTTLGDILGMIGGGGSGEEKKVPCVPPDDMYLIKK